jgi:hypothetical protein
MWTRVQPAYAANMWNEALNKRLGTEVLLLFLTSSRPSSSICGINSKYTYYSCFTMVMFQANSKYGETTNLIN